ncbi:ABC transporter substrate-binding protein [Bradyrhizobium arachidis]|uniref:Branched-chain amino acid ABC transporter substrate-binding protein n=1 Tax=Bradyrhizobium arachidis TaxID=858423 RepID=A0AAE7NWW0_9BRAD|nr:ABC transporter substrate-binding protein [Bradyrhizobium arachidis]QOZ73514.1 branched-chain amino acid ABC transporter substrate-binding protein [Bradyrhizobium arachidis]SFV19319.1 ABC-type branched-chain amino acid transport system, substrate-binding protein [Bradyrhizobium arachidis]
MIRPLILAALSLSIVGPSPVAAADKKYGPGVSDTEIRIGQTAPYSGPLSSLSRFGRIEAAYLNMINATGGINGRKVTLVSLDDAFSPTKTVQQTRKLVEDDNVLAIVGSIGTPTNLAVAKYLNGKQVPQILVLASTPKLDDPENLPWTTTFMMPQPVETKIYAEYLLKTKPDAKVAVIYQNDDLGKGNLAGFKAALGSRASTMVVAEAAYDIMEPTVDSQVVVLKASGADTLFHASNARFAAQAIRKAHELNWKVQHVLLSGVSSISAVLRPAGLTASTGAVSAFWLKTSEDPMWDDDAGMREFRVFMKQWAPNDDIEESIFPYATAQMIVEVLKKCGDDLSRENLIRQATSVQGLQLPTFLPGLTINITPSSRIGWTKARMARFNGTRWVLLDDFVGN